MAWQVEDALATLDTLGWTQGEQSKMTEPIEIRSGGHLLFVLTPQGHVECFRDGWLHTIDIIATLTAGTPCVTRRYVGKRILTKIDISDRVVSDN